MLLRGLFEENPIFRLALSLCPAVAVTTAVKNGLMLGVAVLVVQVLSSMSGSMVKHFINPKIRIPVFTLLIAIWVSAMDMILAAFFSDIYQQVGLYVKLIVAFAIIISRMELFSMKHSVMASFWDGLGMGLGFLVAVLPPVLVKIPCAHRERDDDDRRDEQLGHFSSTRWMRAPSERNLPSMFS